MLEDRQLTPLQADALQDALAHPAVDVGAKQLPSRMKPNLTPFTITDGPPPIKMDHMLPTHDCKWSPYGVLQRTPRFVYHKPIPNQPDVTWALGTIKLRTDGRWSWWRQLSRHWPKWRAGQGRESRLPRWVPCMMSGKVGFPKSRLGCTQVSQHQRQLCMSTTRFAPVGSSGGNMEKCLAESSTRTLGCGPGFGTDQSTTRNGSLATVSQRLVILHTRT